MRNAIYTKTKFEVQTSNKMRFLSTSIRDRNLEWNGLRMEYTISDSIYCPSDQIFPKLLGTLNGRDIEWNLTIADSIYCPSEQIFPKSFHYLLHTLRTNRQTNSNFINIDNPQTFTIHHIALCPWIKYILSHP